VALDAQTGRTIWQGAGDSRPGYATPVVATLAGRQQIVAFLAEGLVGIDPASGTRLWNFPWPVPHDQASATPIVSGNQVFITTAWNCGSVLLEVGESGPHVLWRSTEMQSRFPSPVLYRGRFYGSHDSSDRLICLDAQTGQLLWKQGGFQQVSVLPVAGALIALEGASGDVVLLDADAARYQELGRIRPLAGHEFWTAPILASGRLLLRSKSTLACIDLR
jgi:hypothetical protein